MTSSNISAADSAANTPWIHPFSVIGHRGAAKLAPENTLSSFRRAVELGVSGVEFDLYAHGGELIVIHDDRLERTTNGHGPVADLPLSELRKLDAGDGQQIPLLQEVVEQLPARIALNLELKGPGTAAPVAAWLAENKPGSDILVSSFDHAELRQFRQLDSQTAVAPLFHKPHADMLTIGRELAASAINLSTRLASARRLGQIRDAGFGALVYTVNGLSSARRLLRDGATGIFTDRPDRITKAALGLSNGNRR